MGIKTIKRVKHKNRKLPNRFYKSFFVMLLFIACIYCVFFSYLVSISSTFIKLITDNPTFKTTNDSGCKMDCQSNITIFDENIGCSKENVLKIEVIIIHFHHLF